MKQIAATMAIAATLAVCMHPGLLAADASVASVNSSKVGSSNTNSALAKGWFGPGHDGGTGYYNPLLSGQYNPYPFYNIVGGQSFGPLYGNDLPDQNESPFNPAMALTQHGSYAPRQMQRNSVKLKEPIAQTASSSDTQDSR